MSCDTESVADICLREAIAEAGDRRREQRKPFLRQACVTAIDSRNVRLPVLCRDLSRDGIGLLHPMPLDPGDLFTLSVPLIGRLLQLRCETVWCRQVPTDHYFSGCLYRCDSTPQSWMLLSAVLCDDLHRRVSRRFPFARPARLENSWGVVREGFCRDISSSGLGLIHRQPLAPGCWIVSVPSSTAGTIQLPVDIRRCLPIGESWYASGGRFAELGTRTTASWRSNPTTTDWE